MGFPRCRLALQRSWCEESARFFEELGSPRTAAAGQPTAGEWPPRATEPCSKPTPFRPPKNGRTRIESASCESRSTPDPAHQTRGVRDPRSLRRGCPDDARHRDGHHRRTRPTNRGFCSHLEAHRDPDATHPIRTHHPRADTTEINPHTNADALTRRDLHTTSARGGERQMAAHLGRAGCRTLTSVRDARPNSAGRRLRSRQLTVVRRPRPARLVPRATHPHRSAPPANQGGDCGNPRPNNRRTPHSRPPHLRSSSNCLRPANQVPTRPTNHPPPNPDHHHRPLAHHRNNQSLTPQHPPSREEPDRCRPSPSPAPRHGSPQKPPTRWPHIRPLACYIRPAAPRHASARHPADPAPRSPLGRARPAWDQPRPCRSWWLRQG